MQPRETVERCGEFRWQNDFFEFKFDQDKEPFICLQLQQALALHNDP